jgi:PAS domain S-box-containing protein
MATNSETAGDLRIANARLKALIDVGLELASERDCDRLLQKVCESTRDLFGASYVTLGILDLKDQTVQRFVSCGSNAPPWIKAGDTVSGLLRTVVAERRALRGNNPDGDPTRLELPGSHPRVQSFLAAPIASPEHIYGWICFVGNEGDGFTEDDEHLVMALSGQVGRIYESDYFHEMAEQRADALEREIAERKQAESALRHQRDDAQRYLDTASVMLVALDAAGRITLVNRHACAILGWTSDELLGRDWIDTCLPERLRATWRTKFHELIDGQIPIGENPVVDKSGHERLIDWRNVVLRDDAGRVTGTFSSGADITERHALEMQLRQAQKMEALGQLTSAIAHDFNNLLTVILGFSSLLLSDLAADSLQHADVSEIHQAAQRAAALTRQLLTFSRKQINAPALLDLNQVVTVMHEMLGRLIGQHVSVTLQLQPELEGIVVDRGQVEQLVMNLVVNARDAMPDGGALTIETCGVELAEHQTTSGCVLAAGPYVRLRVADTGSGMNAEVQAHLFEPFFTTKAAGKGTGLGLATVRGIVDRCGGGIDVVTAVGKGTSFTVYIPQAPAGMEFADVCPAAGSPQPGTQTLLVVDDDPGVRTFAAKLLRRLGYTVLIAANADEARKALERPETVDLILTDVVMPGTSGPELADELVARHPGLKVIFMSGYSEEAIARHGVLRPGIPLVHKPFAADVLSQKIREVLGQRSTC